MTRPRAVPPRRQVRALALLVTVIALAGFLLTSSDRLSGYEPETVAVTEGFVRTGVMQVLRDSPLRSSGHLGRDGRLYGRTTFVQPLLESPFMFVGYHLDAARGGGTQFRRWAARVYSPVMAAVAVLAFFGIVLDRLGSARKAAGAALLFAFASLAWPYSKIGMETTFLALMLVTVWAVLRAHARGSPGAWLLAGTAAGAATACKPYAIVAVAPLGLILLDSVRGRPRTERLNVLVSAIVPVLVFIALMAGHNKLRHGSWTDFGDAERLSPTLAAPLNFLGLFVAPGKGLLLYSPLAILGLLGLRELWRSDRVLAIAVVGPVLAMCAVIAISAHWSDETWGPRYIVPVAGLLILPVSWWAVTRRRRRVRGVVAGVAVVIALLGVLVPYESYYKAAPQITGVPLFQQRTSSAGGTDISDSVPGVPYGRDAFRWIPQVSPMLFDAEVLASTVVEKVSGHGITFSYAPFEGRRTSLDLTGFAGRYDVHLPDLFWLHGHRFEIGIAFLLAVALLAAIAALARELRRPVPEPRFRASPRG